MLVDMVLKIIQFFLFTFRLFVYHSNSSKIIFFNTFLGYDAGYSDPYAQQQQYGYGAPQGYGGGYGASQGYY